MKEGGYHGTPLQQDRRSRRSTGRYPASFSVEWSHGYFHAPLPVPRDLPAGGREVVLPGRRPDCPPSGRRHPQTMEQQSYNIWRHAMTRLMTLMVALSLAVLSIVLGAPRELWLSPPF